MSQENVELTRQAYDAFNRRDLAGFLALMDVEVEAKSRLAAMEGGYQGHDGVRRWWRNLLDAFPDFAIEIVDVHDPEDLTLVTLRIRARGADSDTPLQETIWTAHRFRHGKVVWWRACGSETEALAAAGLRD